MSVSGRDVAKQVTQYSDSIFMHLGRPDLRTPEPIIDAIVKAAKEGKTQYTESEGLLELRELIADKLRTENEIPTQPSSVFVTSGGQAGIASIVAGLVEPGDEVIVSDPGYTPYADNVALRRGKTIYLPLKESNDFSVMAEDLEPLMTKKTKLIMLNSPSNPTGGINRPNELHKIAKIIAETDAYIVSDEIYEKFYYGSERPISIGSLPGGRDRTITLNGFSKAYAMTGLRIGYLALPEAIFKKVLKAHSIINICAPTLSQYAAIAALRVGQEPVQKMAQEYRKRREILLKRLRAMPHVQCATPMGALYAFPRTSYYMEDDIKLTQIIAEKLHVAFSPGSYYGPAGRGHIRMSLTTSADRIDEAMDRLARFLEGMKH